MLTLTTSITTDSRELINSHELDYCTRRLVNEFADGIGERILQRNFKHYPNGRCRTTLDWSRTSKKEDGRLAILCVSQFHKYNGGDVVVTWRFNVFVKDGRAA